MAECHPNGAGADCGRRCDRDAVAPPRQPAGLPSVLSVARLVRALLCRARHQHVSLYRASEHHHLAGGFARDQPDLHAIRCRRANTAHSRLYRVGLLGISRQGQTRKRLSLMSSKPERRPLARRLLWFATLWLAGAGTVAAISFMLRLWLAPR